MAIVFVNKKVCIMNHFDVFFPVSLPFRMISFSVTSIIFSLLGVCACMCSQLFFFFLGRYNPHLYLKPHLRNTMIAGVYLPLLFIHRLSLSLTNTHKHTHRSNARILYQNPRGMLIYWSVLLHTEADCWSPGVQNFKKIPQYWSFYRPYPPQRILF